MGHLRRGWTSSRHSVEREQATRLLNVEPELIFPAVKLEWEGKAVEREDLCLLLGGGVVQGVLVQSSSEEVRHFL